MARSKKTNNSEDAFESFIKPIIAVEGEKHALEQMKADDEMPEMRAVGYMRLSNKIHSWVSYTVTFQGDKITSLEVSEPDMRQVAEETAKIAFVQNFVDAEAM